jgi:uncharacterized protein (TIGR02271 family)
MDGRAIKEGQKVRSLEGTNLGKVVACSADTFIIEKGFFFPKDYMARYDDIAEIREDEIWLAISDEQLREGERLGAGQPIAESRQASGPIQPPYEPVAETDVEPVAGETAPPRREEPRAGTREERYVERRAASETTLDEDVYDEGSFAVPVYEEEVEVTTRPVADEEVRVSKAAREEEERLAAESRKGPDSDETKRG